MSIRFRRALRRVLPIAAALLFGAGLAGAQPRLTLEPHDRVMLVGYGSTASTVGATRAGRIAGRVAARRLGLMGRR